MTSVYLQGLSPSACFTQHRTPSLDPPNFQGCWGNSLTLSTLLYKCPSKCDTTYLQIKKKSNGFAHQMSRQDAREYARPSGGSMRHDDPPSGSPFSSEESMAPGRPPYCMLTDAAAPAIETCHGNMQGVTLTGCMDRRCSRCKSTMADESIGIRFGTIPRGWLR